MTRRQNGYGAHPSTRARVRDRVRDRASRGVRPERGLDHAPPATPPGSWADGRTRRSGTGAAGRGARAGSSPRRVRQHRPLSTVVGPDADADAHVGADAAPTPSPVRPVPTPTGRRADAAVAVCRREPAGRRMGTLASGGPHRQEPSPPRRERAPDLWCSRRRAAHGGDRRGREHHCPAAGAEPAPAAGTVGRWAGGPDLGCGSPERQPSRPCSMARTCSTALTRTCWTDSRLRASQSSTGTFGLRLSAVLTVSVG